MNVRIRGRVQPCKTVTFDPVRNVVKLIEQRLLPHEFKIVGMRTYEETADAIRDMIVRGAGAIGATAAYGLAQGALAFRGKDEKKFQAHLLKVYNRLKDARPTAVDPVNAMNDTLAAIETGATVGEKQRLAVQAAEKFAAEDVAYCRAIGEHGQQLLKEGANVLTHCNAGWLAFVDVGTATAPIYAAHEQGKKVRVFCGETRPRCQGGSLTAWELAQEGIAHAVVADNAVGHLMKRGEIDLVIVGSDRTLGKTGEVANKIGTYIRAVLAKRHKIPFYVAIPLSTIDWNLESGDQIPIEERDASEVLGVWGVTAEGRREYVRISNPCSPARNPGFDVTPPDLITGIITPVGIFKPQDLWKNRHKLGYRNPRGNAPHK